MFKTACQCAQRGVAAAIIAGLLAGGSTAMAKIDLVTLPARDKTELTIYNSQDLTLVRETRALSFSQGLNQIQFSWANTLIDPTSIEINLDSQPGLTVLDAVYPANTSQMIVWNIEAEKETSADVEIRYFSSGLSWSADYVLRANNEQTEFSLQQSTTVRNSSGEDFENAKTRVVVGEVNLLELIADLAREGIELKNEEQFRQQFGQAVVEADEARMLYDMAEMATPMAAGAMKRDRAKEIIKQAVSEYYVFSVEGEEDILNGWGKKLPEKPIEDIEFDLSYEIDQQKYGNQVVKFYKLKNDEDHNLGKAPLPSGSYYVYSDDGRGGLRFEGSTSSKYVPAGEDIELNLGDDGMVLYETRVTGFSRSNFEQDNSGNIIGWDETRTVELEIKNTRDRAVPVKLTHYLQGDWEFTSLSDEDYDKMSPNSVKWELDVDAQSARIVRYTALFRMGTRSRAN